MTFSTFRRQKTEHSLHGTLCLQNPITKPMLVPSSLEQSKNYSLPAEHFNKATVHILIVSSPSDNRQQNTATKTFSTFTKL